MGNIKKQINNIFFINANTASNIDELKSITS